MEPGGSRRCGSRSQGAMGKCCRVALTGAQRTGMPRLTGHPFVDRVVATWRASEGAHHAVCGGEAVSDRVPLLEVGRLLAGLEDLKAKKGEPPWSDAVVLTDDIQAFIICHAPGHPNDTHYDLHGEWWVVLQGEIDWYIEDEPAPIHARAGDFVLGPKNRWHHVEPVGSEPSIRLAINARGEFHRYDRPGCKPL